MPGDGIAILLENHPRFYEIVWGAQRAGLYYTPMSTRLTPGEVEYIVADCDAKVLVTSQALAATSPRRCAIACPACRRRLMLDGTIAGYESWEDAVAAQPATPIADEIEGHGSALLVRHDRPAEGRQARRCAATPLGTPEASVRCAGPLRHGRGHGLPVARAALPRRAAAL